MRIAAAAALALLASSSDSEAKRLRFVLWGAGGGAGIGKSAVGRELSNGGGGGFATAVLYVNDASESFLITVGEGGTTHSETSNGGGSPNGGDGVTYVSGSTIMHSGGGGGSSHVISGLQKNVIIGAGGGGGGGMISGGGGGGGTAAGKVGNLDTTTLGGVTHRAGEGAQHSSGTSAGTAGYGGTLGGGGGGGGARWPVSEWPGCSPVTGATDGIPDPSSCTKIQQYCPRGGGGCQVARAELQEICNEWRMNEGNNDCYRGTMAGFKFWGSLATSCDLELNCNPAGPNAHLGYAGDAFGGLGSTTGNGESANGAGGAASNSGGFGGGGGGSASVLRSVVEYDISPRERAAVSDSVEYTFEHDGKALWTGKYGAGAAPGRGQTGANGCVIIIDDETGEKLVMFETAGDFTVFASELGVSGGEKAGNKGGSGLPVGAIVGATVGPVLLIVAGVLGYRHRETLRGCFQRAADSAENYVDLGNGITMGQIVG